jgi:hypothetical protein
MNIEKIDQNFEIFGSQSLKSINTNDQYLKSYPYILESTSSLIDKLGSSSVITIAHIAYGWMPTILKDLDFSLIEKGFIIDVVKVSSFSDAKLLINNLDKSPINNSWVGLSKVLHFTNPSFFPIWDSKVARHFGVNNYQISKIINYEKYITFVENKINLEIVKKIQMNFRDNLNYEVTKTRACEFILFTN